MELDRKTIEESEPKVSSSKLVLPRARLPFQELSTRMTKSITVYNWALKNQGAGGEAGTSSCITHPTTGRLLLAFAATE